MPVYMDTLCTWYIHTHSHKGKAAVTSVGDSPNTSTPAANCHLWERLLLITIILIGAAEQETAAGGISFLIEGGTA